ncbi:zinc ribbon domain-containing protein [Halobacteriaceae archaeon GCM10025711]
MAATQQEFVCEHCGERIVVDDPVAELLLADGCVYCGSDVTAASFDGTVG